MENNAYDSTGDGKALSDAENGVKKDQLDVGFTKVPEPAKPPADKPYAGMGKEDLLRFSDTPFWNRFRMACLVIFWLAWVGLLVAVIVLTITFPRCTAPPEKSWWQKSVIYQIYVRSFADGYAADGVGDIQGIINKLDHIKDINANAIILSSIFQSSVDFGYGVTNHRAIDAQYGDLTDLTLLIETAHNNSIKVLLDFIPNHTGKDHTWFIQSENNDPQYRNYYVWDDCVDGNTPPTNWRSVYGESAWTRSGAREQCYLHQFLDDQPDLNLRSTQVQEELEGILRFWLGQGIDGFRVNSVKFLFEDSDLRDENQITDCIDPDDHACYEHVYTQNLAETHGMLARWRHVVESFSTEDQPRILITDAWNDEVNKSIAYYGRFGGREAHLPVNYELRGYDNNCGAVCVRELVDTWRLNMPQDQTANWLSDYQDMSRMAMTSNAIVNSMNILKFTLPGSTLVQYGEEIGMVNGVLTTCDPARNCDPAGVINSRFDRINYRTPMQWSSETYAGFSTVTPWIDVNNDYTTKNVEALNNASDTDTILATFRELAAMRLNKNSLHYGNFDWLLENDQSLVAYLREYEGDDSILVAINLDSTGDPKTFNLEADNSLVPGGAEVLVTTSSAMDIQVGDNANLRALTLGPGEGLICSWAYTR